MLKISQLTLVLLSAATLVACGGGSSSGSNTVTPPAAFTSAAYAGNWKEIADGCQQTDVRTTNATGPKLNSSLILGITPLSNTELSFTATLKYFAPTDTGCTGNVLISRTLTSYKGNITGTATFNGLVFDKFQFGTETITTSSLVVGNFTASNSSLGASAATINGYYFPAGYFAAEQHSGEKDYARATATNLFCGDQTGTATTYPTGVNTAPCFVKI